MIWERDPQHLPTDQPNFEDQDFEVLGSGEKRRGSGFRGFRIRRKKERIREQNTVPWSRHYVSKSENRNLDLKLKNEISQKKRKSGNRNQNLKLKNEIRQKFPKSGNRNQDLKLKKEIRQNFPRSGNRNQDLNLAKIMEIWAKNEIWQKPKSEASSLTACPSCLLLVCFPHYALFLHSVPSRTLFFSSRMLFLSFSLHIRSSSLCFRSFFGSRFASRVLLFTY